MSYSSVDRNTILVTGCYKTQIRKQMREAQSALYGPSS